ncbi:MAG: hypothetical protein HOV81_44035 [Kofleriaceae bacterium]|nr:hypothetical protein [Kofleriaceae bacterium]
MGDATELDFPYACAGFQMAITREDADAMLDGLPLVPAMAGTIAEMKALRERCLAADIPAAVGCPSGGVKSS